MAVLAPFDFALRAEKLLLLHGVALVKVRRYYPVGLGPSVRIGVNRGGFVTAVLVFSFPPSVLSHRRGYYGGGKD